MSPKVVASPTLNKPDTARLKELHRQVNTLIAQDKWTYEAFVDILEKAKPAAAGFGEALGFLFRAAKPEWRKKHWEMT